MTDEEPLEAAPCPVCGMPNEVGARVCERCGTPLARSGRSSAPAREPSSPSPEPPSEPPDPLLERETDFEREPISGATPEPEVAATDPEQTAIDTAVAAAPTGTDAESHELPADDAIPEDAVSAAPDQSLQAAAVETPPTRARHAGNTWSRLNVATRGHLRDQAGRILIGGGVGLLVLVALLALLPPTPHTGQAAQGVPQAAVPTPTPAPPATTTHAATVGPSSARTIVRDVAVLGAQAGLLAPQEAVQLRNGTIAVVDTGHKRLTILDARGNLLKSVTAGASSFKEPFAVATAGGTVYVLDSAGDTIDRFTLQGQYRGAVLHDPALDRARGMALGRNGTILVANPASNSVLTLTRTGQILHTLGGAVGTGPTQLSQPSDVASGKGGLTFILDNNNQRVQIVSAANTFTGQRPAPSSSTVASAHILPLPDGRLLVSDPTGALLLYPSNGGSATRIVLRVKGDSSTHISPLGLALTGGGRVLITDTTGNRLLVLSVARL